LAVSAADQTPYLAAFYNATYSTTTPVFEYYAFDTGVFGMGTPADKAFYLYTNGNNNARFYILGTGEIGMGVGEQGTVGVPVTIRGGVSAGLNTALKVKGGSQAAGAGPAIDFNQSWANTLPNWITARIGSTYQSGSYGGNLVFYTNTGTTETSYTEKMRIDKDGKLKITGTIFPYADGTTAMQFLKADGTTAVATIDTTNSRLGIGTTAPASLFHLNATAVAGTRETLMRASVSDGGNSLFEISNATATDNRFLPTFMGYIDSTNASSSVTFRGLVSAANDASDSATSGIIDFQAFRTASATNPNAGSFADCTNRKLFTFSKQSAVLATITAAGNLGVGVTPAATIHALATTEQLRLGYDASNYLSFTVGSANAVTLANAVAADVTLNCGTEKTLVLAQPVWDDVRVTPSGFDRAGVADPSLVSYTPTGSSIATFLYEFQVDDVAYFTVQMPHGYKQGTDINCHVHWTPGLRGNEENGATVGWKVDYTWANIDGTFGAMSTADLSDACDGTDDKHQMTPSVTITGTGKNISSMLLCNIKRTDTGADDTWAGTASGQLPMLLEIDFHYQIDTLGSRQAGIK
jgi:hypothetical protein